MNFIKTHKRETLTILYVWLIICLTPQQIFAQQNLKKNIQQSVLSELGTNINSLKENNDYLKAELFAIFSKRYNGDFLMINTAIENIATDTESQKIFFDYLYNKFEPYTDSKQELSRYTLLFQVLKNRFLLTEKNADILARHIGELEYLTEPERKSKLNNETNKNPQESYGNKLHVEDSLQKAKIEEPAEFPGGETSWHRYLQKNLKSNIPYDNKAPNGRYSVVLRFIVRKNGTITDIKPETNFGYGMESEAVRILENSPKWRAALKTGGESADSYHRLSIIYLVEQNN